MNVIGIMSGTSCDGLDIAYCEFTHKEQWQFKIIHAVTIPYPYPIHQLLAESKSCSGLELTTNSKIYGKYIGETVTKFINDLQIKPDLLASHGHTIFHEPNKGVNLQIGDGNLIAAITGIPTVYNFRSMDIALGGQGAPLVPMGDKLLFSAYDYCINIGGFSNISYDEENKRIAFDICPTNIAFNRYAQKAGKEYDDGGKIGASGTINQELLDKLNNLSFYQQKPPKSLGTEWLEEYFMPVLQQFSLSPSDMLSTLYKHTAIQIAEVINQSNDAKVLITGGGALNTFLVDLIKAKTHNTIIVPDQSIVEYKEALIFAFLGLLRYQNKINCLSSVTGAKRDSSCGVVAVA